MRKPPNIFAIFAILATVVAFVSSFEPALMRAELATVDYRFRVRGPRKTNAKVVVVSVDDATEKAWKDRPMVFWGDSFAKIIDRCVEAGAQSVAIDFLFPRDFDSYLAKLAPNTAPSPTFNLLQSIADHEGRIWIARRSDALPFSGSETLPEFYESSVAPYLGIVDLPPSEDGVVRSLYHFIQEESNFARSLAQCAARPETKVTYGDPAEFNINFVGTEFPQYSAISIVDESADLSRLKGAIVVLCATYSGSSDMHETPTGTAVPGGMVLADGIATLIDHREIRSVGPLACAVWSALLALGTTVAAGRVKTLPMLATLLIGAAAYTALALYLFALDWQIPVASAVWAVVVGGFFGNASQAYRNLADRAKVEKIMGVMVSDSVKKEILRTGGSATNRREEAAIMFLDIRSFTTWSESRPPENVVSMINSVLNQLIPIVDEEGGYVNTFLGDGFLAVFGPPNTLDNPSESALLAAERIVLEMNRLSPSLADDANAWKLGIGVHYGPVLLGAVGTENRHQFTVMGNTVNTAQRLEGMCKELGCSIVVSDAVASRISQTRAMIGPTDLRLRGLTQTVASYAYTPIEV